MGQKSIRQPAVQKLIQENLIDAIFTGSLNRTDGFQIVCIINEKIMLLVHAKLFFAINHYGNLNRSCLTLDTHFPYKKLHQSFEKIAIYFPCSIRLPGR